jgi:teichuronic acid biosynthesis glycosyltransferase TuaG
MIMSEDVKVSIVTPAYNAMNTIEETIQSVINQSFSNWEMIVVNDASIDDTKTLVEQFAQQDDRIKLINLKTNKGVSNARNVALKHTTGTYIAFLDADDIWKPTKLKKQLTFMLENNISFSFTGYDIVDYNLNHIKQVTVPKVVTDKTLMRNTIVGCLTVMLKKDHFSNIKFPNLDYSEDIYTWIELLKTGTKAYGINESLATYRLQPKTKKQKSNLIKKWTFYRVSLKQNVVMSLFNMTLFILNYLKKRYL